MSVENNTQLYTGLFDSNAIKAFVEERQSAARFVRDVIDSAVDKQKAAADERGRINLESFKVGDSVLLSTMVI